MQSLFPKTSNNNYVGLLSFLLNLFRRGCSSSNKQKQPHFILLRKQSESGQVLVLGLFVALGLAMIAISVANVGMMVAEKIHVQDTVDAAAYSSAVVEARYMNLSAYINRAMIANYNAMAFNTALWATVDAYDHGLASVIGLMYLAASVIQVFPPLYGIAQALDNFANVADNTAHKAFHIFNEKVTKASFSQEEADLNKYIEIYNTDILSTYSGVLYAAMQSARYSVAESVANKMDDEIMTTTVLGLGAETSSAEDLKKTVDWIIDDPDEREAPFDTLNETFNKVHGEEASDSEHKVLLAALGEASLDKFAAGRNREGTKNLIRAFNFGDIMPGWMKTGIKAFIWGECIAECGLTLGFSCDCDTETEIVIGSDIRPGQEDHFYQSRVPVIARRRMREANLFGIRIKFGKLYGPKDVGHTSGERRADIANSDNKLEPIGIIENPDRFIECMFSSDCTLNQINSTLSQAMGFGVGGTISEICGLIGDMSFNDDHWDGAFDPPVACGVRHFNFGAQICWGDLYDYISKVCSNGFEDGVPRYDWRVDLNNVGWPNLVYDTADVEARPAGSSGGGDENLYFGPSVAVVGVKRAEDVNGLRGLGIGNDYSISAIARAQVYYLRNPNRPDERPSLLNPHWAARLAPMDHDDTPELIRKGLPFLASHGVPIAPTH